MKTVWIIGGIVVIGGLGWFMWHQRQASATALAMPSDTYSAPATKGNITQSVTSPGVVASNLDVAIKCRASGEVKALPFHISDSVKKGDVLLQLDTKDELVVVNQAKVTLAQANSKLLEAQEAEKMAELDLQTATEQAATNVEAAQIKAVNLRNKAERLKDLLAKNLASTEDYETAQTDAAQADTALQVAKIAQEELKSQAVALEVKKEDVNLASQQVQLDSIALDNANTQLGYTTVAASMDGVISDLQIQLGTIISSATSIVGGSTVMTLTDLSHIFVLASVDESDIGGIQVGQEVDLTADAFPGKHFGGKVVQIAVTGVSTSNVVTFQVKIEVISKNKGLLKPQMTTSAKIIEANHSDVVLVPSLAVVRRGPKTFITVQKPGQPDTELAVQIGISDDENTEIVGGISPGDQVLVHKSMSANRWTGSATPQPRPITAVPGSGGGRR